jgi:two-component system chemotaxis response regulator CheY
VSQRILIVDRTAGVRSTLAVALRGSGYEVAHAGNARQCLARLAGGAPSLVLLDYAMPAAEGLRCREILSRHPASATQKLVVLTPTDDTRFAARSVDALAVVPKPADGDGIVELVERYLRPPRTRPKKRTPRSDVARAPRAVPASQTMRVRWQTPPAVRAAQEASLRAQQLMRRTSALLRYSKWVIDDWRRLSVARTFAGALAPPLR